MAKCAVVMIITNTCIIAFVVIFITNLLNSSPNDKVGSGEDEESTGEEESEVDCGHQEACARALR